MIVFKILNALVALSAISIFIEGLNILKRREAVITRMTLFGKGKKSLVAGAQAIILGWQYIILGGFLALAGAIGAVTETDLFGIPINVFGGLLCMLPFYSPLIIYGFVLQIKERNEKPKRNW